VLKRTECIDRRVYDSKVYEYDTWARFRGHPNLISIYSYWSEKASSPYKFKALVGIFEEGVCGDILNSVVLNSVRPPSRLALKYLCDIAKGLSTLHNSSIVHASVKPSSIYIQADNTAMLGEIGRAEAESVRLTTSSYSKMLIAEAMPHTLIYWPPELLIAPQTQKLTTQGDMWALGITMY
jgi:serine/threonine protein kinase